MGRHVRVSRAEFEALLERSRTAPPSETELRQAQAFWEGELLPTPMVAPAEGD